MIQLKYKRLCIVGCPFDIKMYTEYPCIDRLVTVITFGENLGDRG